MNSLALSTEYVLRTGAFDHTRKHYSSPEEMKEVTSQLLYFGEVPIYPADNFFIEPTRHRILKLNVMRV